MRFAGAEQVNQIGFALFTVVDVALKEVPQAFDTHRRRRVSGEVEVVSYRFVAMMDGVSQMFLEAGGEGTSGFSDVQLITGGAGDHIDQVFSVARKMLFDVEGATGTLEMRRTADEWTDFTVRFVARRSAGGMS